MEAAKIANRIGCCVLLLRIAPPRGIGVPGVGPQGINLFRTWGCNVSQAGSEFIFNTLRSDSKTTHIS